MCVDETWFCEPRENLLSFFLSGLLGRERAFF